MGIYIHTYKHVYRERWRERERDREREREREISRASGPKPAPPPSKPTTVFYQSALHEGRRECGREGVRERIASKKTNTNPTVMWGNTLEHTDALNPESLKPTPYTLKAKIDSQR